LIQKDVSSVASRGTRAVYDAAYTAALISGLIVAWQAGRVSPAEALRNV
jgi:ABC-type lipoprotein release transport system permease subunit